MAQKKSDGSAYRELTAAIASGTPGNLYIFHGEERYLIDHSLAGLRRVLCPNGTGGFNYRRFDDSSLTPDELENAVDTFPAFADRTLIEVHDFDVFKGGEEQKNRLAGILEGLPEYVCLVFIYDTVVYKPDNRQKLTARLLKNASVVEFARQEQDKLVKWIKRHFADTGKQITSSDAEYLAFITGGFMTALDGEIEKVAAFSRGDTIVRSDIDAVVEPILDAVAYKLTDAIAGGRHADAARILCELFEMREPPHKLLYGITLKMRQLLAARICIDSGARENEFMELCGIKYSFQARPLMDAARKTSLRRCRSAVLSCAETALELNSSPEPESRLIELLARLAFAEKGAAR